MSTISYQIRVSLASKMELSAGITKDVIPLLNQAVHAVAQATAADWKTEVYKAKLWSGEKDAYAASITYRMTGDFSAVVEATYEKAAEIETGRPPRDLKKMLDTSGKVRRTTDGRRFLVIPMRHNTPGNGAHAKAMPSSVYEMAQAMAPSRVIAAGQRPSGEITHLSPKTGMHPASHQTPYLSAIASKQAATVVARKYAWGDRITGGMLKAAGMSKAEARRYAGMVRMDTSTPGGAKSSSYMTFRIMMEGQTGKWIVPAQPGQYIAKKVSDAMQPKAEKAFSAAIQKTVSG